MRSPVAIGAALIGICVAGCAGVAPVRFSDGVLVNDAGMSLYTFDSDPSGRSACNDRCAADWPPLRASADARPGGEYSVITRDDGSKQWAYRGKALYLWSKDRRPGDRTGDGVGRVWHLVQGEPMDSGGGGGY